MKLEKILDELNSFEKNSFLKVLTVIIENSPNKTKEIDTLLIDSAKDLKTVDNINIAKVFNLLENEFANWLAGQLVEATSQFDILIDILVRDGNGIMSINWFNKLYEDEIQSLKIKLKDFETDLKSEKSEISDRRKRDYLIYRECLKTAYYNDRLINHECKVTSDEQSILNTLSKNLGLSQEEVKLINYLIIKVEKHKIDDVVNELKNLGILFFSKKTLNVYIADEVVRVLRVIRGKEVADKYYRRVLKQLKEPQINMIAKNHNINWHDSLEVKIKKIIKEGINLSDILINDIFKEETKVLEKKTFLNIFISKSLNIDIKGATIEDKVDNLIKYFNEIEKDEKVGISVDGFEKMLVDIHNKLPHVNAFAKKEFELEEENVLQSEFLLNYNIKPRDILDLIPEDDLKKFCEIMAIKTRGNIVSNTLEAYKDAANLFIENYPLIAFRDTNALKENGIIMKEAEFGVKFEEITKNIFSKLGFNVDESLRKKINTAKDKIDIILNLGDEGLIIIECKTNKDSGYNKFSAVTKQVRSYIKLAHSKGHRIIKTLLIAPEFSEDFEKECREEFELNLSLITAETLVNILNGFKNTKLKQLPFQLLMKDVLIKEDWVIKAINK